MSAWCLTSTETIRLIRDGEKGEREHGGGGRGGGGIYIYLSLHCHHQNDSCMNMGSNEDYLNVSFIVRDSHKTVSANHHLSEEKGEPKRNRTEVRVLTSLTPYH